MQVLGDVTAFLILVTSAVLYFMGVHGVATHFLNAADACWLCLAHCLMRLGVLTLLVEAVLPLTLKVMFRTFKTTTQAQVVSLAASLHSQGMTCAGMSSLPLCALVARTHARMHARTHARSHARTHTGQWLHVCMCESNLPSCGSPAFVQRYVVVLLLLVELWLHQMQQ